MNAKDITEIRNRLKVDSLPIIRIAGCYVGTDKQKVTTFSTDSLSMSDDEESKYLELARKSLSGKVGNNLLNLSFQTGPECTSQQSLLELSTSKFEDEEALDAFFDSVIDIYDSVEHYLILLFYDIYDVPKKGTDGVLLDESEDVFEYLIGCICPVSLSPQALGYFTRENCIAPRVRDWVVGMPESAFMFPSFIDRSADVHHVTVYTKNPKEPHIEFWANVLGLEPKATSAQKREALLGLVANEVDGDNDAVSDALFTVQSNMHDYSEHETLVFGAESEVGLNTDKIVELIEDCGIDQDACKRVAESYEGAFTNETTHASELYDTRALKDSGLRKERKLLRQQIVSLHSKLKSVGFDPESCKDPDIAITLPPDREYTIEGDNIIIPLHRSDDIVINGAPVELC